MKSIKKNKTFSVFLASISKWQVKLIFALIAISIIIGTIIFTQTLVNEIIEREKYAVELYAKTNANLMQNLMNDTPNTSSTDVLLFFVENVTPTINFPVIVTFENDKPYEPFESWTLNIPFKKNMNIQDQRKIVHEYLEKMKETYPPILVRDETGKIISKFYYSHSILVDKLRFFPIIAIFIISLFGFIGYISFSLSRDSEQNKIWVGMSKEAAHQLGTPLSSLLAWIEILKYDSSDPEAVKETLMEMEKDVERLNTIAKRFSKIGSTPEKELINLSVLISSVCNYFDKRVPHLGKKIEIIQSLDDKVWAKVNIELFAWVIENLLKNAVEAIETRDGKIYIYMRYSSKGKVSILVKDTGKGIPQKMKKQVFYPGFSTKKRGWGLGLSLTKRIVEEYHDGKIFVKESIIGKGTTFAIELPIEEIKD